MLMGRDLEVAAMEWFVKVMVRKVRQKQCRNGAEKRHDKAAAG
jgi:hypothetical protein